tara:strand:+ start:13376 stop:13849 length:474 start_codon:yes stop_codon:yes gene_type:complete
VATEIERKFLVTGDAWLSGACVDYRQGYLSTDKERTLRVRVAGKDAFITVKGVTRNTSRLEYEYAIPVTDADEMLDRLCLRPLITKRRYRIEHQGMTWEVDEFTGDNEGLVLAEIELEYEGQSFDVPEWIGEEVTGDPRYYNASLVEAPFNTWRESR